MVLLASHNAPTYFGLTTDEKPTADVPPGAIFWERDAGAGTVQRYLFDGDEWGLDAGGSEVNTNLLVPRVLTGEAVIDEAAANWTGAQDLVTIAPADGAPLREARLDLDLAKATTGFAAGYTSQTLTLTVLRKTDGTNWRKEAALTAISGTNAALRIVPIALGTVGVTDAVKVTATLSSENGGSVVSEIPYRLHYLASVAPTVTAAE